MIDQVKSIETKDGILWAYIERNKIVDQVFWTWEQLYKHLVEVREIRAEPILPS